MACAKYSLNHKFYHRLRQLKFIREYRDIFELAKPLNKLLPGPHGVNVKLPGRFMHTPIGAKPNKIRTFSALPQSDILTTPYDLYLNGEAIFHQRPAHVDVQSHIRQLTRGTSETTTYLIIQP